MNRSNIKKLKEFIKSNPLYFKLNNNYLLVKYIKVTGTLCVKAKDHGDLIEFSISKSTLPSLFVKVKDNMLNIVEPHSGRLILTSLEQYDLPVLKYDPILSRGLYPGDIISNGTDIITVLYVGLLKDLITKFPEGNLYASEEYVKENLNNSHIVYLKDSRLIVEGIKHIYVNNYRRIEIINNH